MPATKYYTVTQEREVRVSAEDEIQALHVAKAAFDGEVSSEAGALRSSVEVIDLNIRKDH